MGMPVPENDLPSSNVVPESDLPDAVTPKKSKAIGDILPNIGLGEAVLSGITGMAAAPISGLAGGAAALMPGLPAGSGADVTNAVGNALTYQPRSELGQKIASGASSPFEWLANKADIAGEKVRENTDSPLLATAANTAIQSIPLVVGSAVSKVFNRPAAVAAREKATKLNAPIDKGIESARDAGLVMTPSQMEAGTIPKIIEGLAGEPKLAKLASEKNAPVINALIRKDVGLPEDVPISRVELAKIRKEEGKAYEAVKNSGTLQTDLSYKNDLANIRKSYDTAATDFAHRSENPFKKIIDGLDKKSFDAASAVEEIKLLRGDADTAYNSGNKSLGKAYKDMAQALDDQLLRHLQNTGPTKIHADYLAARQRIAKTYAADAALNDSTGNINAAMYANALKNGKKLSGEAETVARFAQQFPRSAQRSEKIGSTGPTIMDLLMATMGKEALLAGARPVARHGLLAGPIQDLMAGKGGEPVIRPLSTEIGLGMMAAEQKRRKEKGLPPLTLQELQAQQEPRNTALHGVRG